MSEASEGDDIKTEGDDIKQLLDKPLGTRIKGYLKFVGPGYMQSAMTLGGGSVASCAALGSMFGYKYLWVQIVAMMLGFVVLAAVAKQTTNSGERAYGVFWRELHPAFAIFWAVSALVATILWHIPQYSLTANGIITLLEGLPGAIASQEAIDSMTGISKTAAINEAEALEHTTRMQIGIVVLTLATIMVCIYHSGAKGLKIYERVIKLLILMVVGAFGIAAFTGEGLAWGELFKGLFGITFLQEGFEGDMALRPVIGALAAAVGINMIFLYPYSILERKWGKEHKELAYTDLLTGMTLPFIVATSLMIIAVAKTIGPDPGMMNEVPIKDVREIIPVLSGSLGEGWARLIIGLGMTAIGFSTIITHMLATGFIGCEMFGLKHEGNNKILFSLLPAIGVVGVVWKFPLELAITASVLAMPLMPVTVLCFLVLMNKKSYMGDAMPTGKKRVLWNTGLSIAVIIMSWAAVYVLQSKYEAYKDKQLSAAEAPTNSRGGR